MRQLVVANSRANNVQLMDRAQVPGAPFPPNTRKDWGYAILFGLARSLGLVVSIEHFDDKLKTPEDVTRRLGVPVLGLLPALQRPTVAPLSDDDWVAVTTIIEESSVRELIPKLKAARAEGIVEHPLNKIVL